MVALGTAMAKKMGRPSKGRDDTSIKIDRIVARKAKDLATHRGVSVAELVTELVRAPIEKAWMAMIRERDEQGGKS